MNITQKSSPNHYNGRNDWKPDMIVCHITDGSYDGAVSWLCNPRAEASAHYVVSRTGQVTQLVSLTDAAWCNGTSVTAGHAYHYSTSTLPLVRQRATNANYYTISIEHEGMYNQTHGTLTAAQQAATIELIKHIRAEVQRLYGITIPVDRQHIVGHCEISPREKPTCPGERFPWSEILRQMQVAPQVKPTATRYASKTAAVRSDTTMDITLPLGHCYTYKLTCSAGRPLTNSCNSSIVDVSFDHQSGNDYFFRCTTKRRGCAGVAVNGRKIFAVKVV